MTLLDNPNLWMTGLFFLAVAITGFVMKLVVLLLPRLGDVPRTNIFWLLVSPTSHLRLKPISSINTLIFYICLNVLALAMGCVLVHFLVSNYKLPLFVQGYLAAPLLFLMTDLLHRCFTIFWLPGGKLLPAIHDRPWLANNIANFWGRRWNLWFSDWFRYAIFQRMRRRPLWGILTVFVASGIIHEWVINVPLYLVFEVNQFGSMMFYFFLQPFGIILERTLKMSQIGSFCLTWTFVLGPCPLIINEGLLRIMHLHHERSNLAHDVSLPTFFNLPPAIFPEVLGVIL